ncbi:unnamed protein product [Bathycoccus prasinos]
MSSFKVVENYNNRYPSMSSFFSRKGRRTTPVVVASSSSTTNKREVWEVSKPGSLSALELRKDVPLLPLEDEDKVRVEVKCIGLNFADVFTVLGLYGATPKNETFIPGLNSQRVMGVTRFGAFASVVDVPRHQVRVIPDAWSFSEGAAFIVQSLTVYYGLSALGRIREGDVCLIHSASGGCGSQALQICDKIGANAIAVIGDESKKGFLEKKHGGSLPASAIIVRDRKTFVDQVREAAQRSYDRSEVDIVLDATLGDFFEGGWNNLSKGRGVYVVYGAADMTPRGGVKWYNLWNWLILIKKFITRPKIDAMELPGENKTIAGFNLIWMFDKSDLLLSLLSELEKLELPPPRVGMEFSWEELPKALEAFQSGKTSGKIVIKL